MFYTEASALANFLLSRPRHGEFHPQLRERERPRCCPRASPTCSSTGRANRSRRWRPDVRRTTSARCWPHAEPSSRIRRITTEGLMEHVQRAPLADPRDRRDPRRLHHRPRFDHDAQPGGGRGGQGRAPLDACHRHPLPSRQVAGGREDRRGQGRRRGRQRHAQRGCAARASASSSTSSATPPRGRAQSIVAPYPGAILFPANMLAIRGPASACRSGASWAARWSATASSGSSARPSRAEATPTGSTS